MNDCRIRLFRVCFGWIAWTALIGSACAQEAYRRIELSVPKAGKTGFTMLTPAQTHLTFTNLLSEDRHLTNQILLNGSGVAAGDVDGDGKCDLYFCQLDGPNALFRNLGNWKFEEVAAAAGVACPELDSTGAVLADIDGDRDLDLIVNSVGKGTHVFLNDGSGRFQRASPAAGLNPGKGGMSMALADVDGDGDLDCYVANYRTVTIRDQPNTKFSIKMIAGQPVVTAIDGVPMSHPDLTNRFTFRISMGEGGGKFGHDENGEADVLFLNDGKGGFHPVSFTGGTFLDEHGQPLAQPPFDWGLSVMMRDINGDGAPDIYVCNDFKSPERIWINDGKGRFQAIDPLAIRQASLSAMGVDFADINRDGFDEIFVVDMLSREHERRHSQRIDIKPEILSPGQIDNRPQYPRNTLFLNRGDGTYAEIAQYAGLEASEWSWTPIFLDVDLDGYEDLLVSNGFERDGMNVDVLMRLEAMKRAQDHSRTEQLRLRKIFPRLALPNLAFRNLGNMKFAETGAEWGFHTSGISHGMALADLDGDGDLDVVVNNLNTAAGIYRNDTVAPRVAVRLKGKAPNTHGIGARIKLTGGPVPQSQEIISGGRYLSSDEPLRTFAAGKAPMQLEVRWRSGLRSVIKSLQPNGLYEIDESQAERPPPEKVAGLSGPAFEDVGHLLQHTHQETEFDDFALQPSLPRRYSQLGPGVAWCDIDGDGWEDLLIGSGRGGQFAAYRNNGQGGFERLSGSPWSQAVTRDQNSLLAWRDGQRVRILAGSSNYEDGLTNGSVAREYDLKAQRVQDSLPGQRSSTGPLALADLDGDGSLDLFVGGRVIPAKYPQAASSLLFRGGARGFQPDQSNQDLFEGIGLVSGAVFSDLDGDGDPELILACEWGPLRVFRNENGNLSETTSELGLAAYRGWWNGVSTGDFDGDGRLDIVASNWGRNRKHEAFSQAGLRIYFADVEGDGFVELAENYFNSQRKQWLPLQPYHVAGAAMPWLREQFDTYAAYAKGTSEELFAGKLHQMHEANWFDSTLFLNRGDHFEARALPMEAQLAPAFAICVADLDGDGNEDVFLSQNFFAVEPETSRYDAGRGLWLRGDGRGNFDAISGAESGLRIYGEQRGAAVCDYDADGRADLVVAQNGAATKLYRNKTGRPGLRVRLAGPPENPLGIGAAIRLVLGGDRMGPAREIQAGSGNGSQNSAVQVLGGTEALKALWVRWPGGKTTTTELPPDAKEVVVDASGKLTAKR